MEYFLDNDLAYFFHTSFFTNYSSYLVGILFGAIYYQYGNLKVTVNKVIKEFKLMYKILLDLEKTNSPEIFWKICF